MLGGVTPHADDDSLPPTTNTSVGCSAEPDTVPLAHTALDPHGHVPVSPFIGNVCEPLFLCVSAKYSWLLFYFAKHLEFCQSNNTWKNR